MPLDPRRLLTFRAVAERRSFSSAAADLSMTQSAVSQQIAALERQVGVRLLRRGRGGVAPTEAGERLLVHAAAVAERIALADAQLSELAGRAARELRVGAFPSALATIVPDAVTRLAAAHPELEIGLVEGTTDELAARVRRGDLHAAVCYQDAASERREHEGTRRRDLLEEPMMVSLPPRHRLARRSRVALAELAGDPWLASSRDGLIARACRAAGFEPRMPVLTGDPLASAAAVRAGLAVTLTPRLLPHDGVRTIAIAGAGPRRTLYALLPAGATRALDGELVAELERAATARAQSVPRR